MSLTDPPQMPLSDTPALGAEGGLSDVPLAPPAEGGGAAAADPNACPKCGTPSSAESQVDICRACGWYERLGTYVEMDQWEVQQATGTEPPPQADVSHVDVWINLLPKWAWALIAINLAILVESVAVRLLTGEDLRMIWSIAQLLIGFLAFVACHITTYMLAIFQDSDYGLLDILLKPIKIWQPTWRKLPKSLLMVGCGSGGIMAAVCSFLVIGALPYEMLWDWGIEAPPKTSLMQAIANQGMPASNDDKSLDEAVQEFAATAAAKPGGDPFEKTRKKKPVAREFVDCVIIGFTTYKSDPQYINSIIVAHDIEGRLVVGGRIRPWFDKEYSAKFVTKLSEFERKYPFIKNEYEARWVEPQVICRVTCKRINSKGRLVEAKFEELRTKLEFD